MGEQFMVVHKIKRVEKKLSIDYQSLGYETFDSFLITIPGCKIYEKYWMHSANLPPHALKEHQEYQKKKRSMKRQLTTGPEIREKKRKRRERKEEKKREKRKEK